MIIAYITAMIIHLFIISSAVQISEISYKKIIQYVISSPKRVYIELTE